MAMTETARPVRMLGGPMSRRQLHFVWILDISGSMRADGKIQALNVAISEAVPALRAAAQANMSADVMLRAITFSTGARWHVGDATPVARFRWTSVEAGGFTDMGAALTLLAEGMQVPPMPERGLAPVLVLVSDGQPTDDFDTGLRRLLATSWGSRSVRLAIAIGNDADRSVLQAFIGHGAELRPVLANDPDAIVAAIRWASTAVAPSFRPSASAITVPGDEDLFYAPDDDAAASP
jgi:uncharacterized protein YegL